jgi:AcrR family transcriptional regulator
MNQTQHNRSEESILQAFRHLVLSEPYDDIRVGDIVRGSEVGRSTFYDHFQDKDDVLITSMQGIFRILSDSLIAPPPIASISSILLHFAEHQQQARLMMNSPSQKLIVRGLAEAMTSHLTDTYTLPINLVSLHLADAAISLIRHWLSTELTITSEELAKALCRSLQALCHSYRMQ